MTNNLSSSKLPNPLTSESNRRDVGIFFPSPNFAAPQGSASFESLIPRNDSKRKKDEEADELEAAKKRKKNLEQFEQSTQPLPPSVSIAICATPDLSAPTAKGVRSEEFSKTKEQSQDFYDKSTVKPASTASTENIQQKEATELLSTNNDRATANNEASFENQSTQELGDKATIDSTVKVTPDGMENALNDSEMISIATSDAMEFGAIPSNGLSPISSPVVNSLAATMADESSVSPIGATSGSSESSLGNFSQGAGAASAPLLNTLGSKVSRSSEATAILKTLSIEVEKLKQTGKSQIDLELQISDTDSVKIRLQVRGEEIRSVFITESPELRQALQKSWGEFAQSSRDRGFRFGDPTFQNPFSQNNSASEQGQQRGQSRDQADTHPYPGYVNRQQPQRSSTKTDHAGSVSLWA
jgi:hypothetical protein